MRNIKSMCVLGLANLGCTGEALDIAVEDKKHNSTHHRMEKTCIVSQHETEIWFKEYLRAHRERDVMNKEKK